MKYFIYNSEKDLRRGPFATHGEATKEMRKDYKKEDEGSVVNIIVEDNKSEKKCPECGSSQDIKWDLVELSQLEQDVTFQTGYCPQCGIEFNEQYHDHKYIKTFY